MKKFIRLVVGIALLACSSNVEAGVSGSSLLDITNLKVSIVSPSRAATGTFKTNAAAGVADFRIGGSTTTAVNTANLNAIQDITSGGRFIQGTTSGGTDFGQSDAALATAASGTNFFNADSSFGGSALDVAGVFGLSYGGSARTTSSFNIDDPGFIGDSNGNVNNFASIAFSTSSDLTAEISFDASVLLSLASTGSPQVKGFASTSFGVTLIRTGANAATIIQFDPSFLNQSISVSGIGTSSYSTPGAVTISTGPLNLVAGANYTLTLNQTASVNVETIPEPASFLVIAGLFTCGVGFRRRK